ncbi:MAG: lysophospholipid acyltransferase family protein [Planctomycetales bacterium]
MRIRSRFLTLFVGWLVALIFRALSRTLRFHGHTEAPGTDPSYQPARTFIYALWHDSILIPLARAALTRPRIAALVSRHQDGSYLSEFMRHLGVRSIRGSTNRGGDQALRALLDQADDWHIFITPDGPRGPHHQIKEGMLYLASRTGRPIVPIVSHYPCAWHLKGSWTGLWIPKPFSRCYYLLGKPLHIPPDLTRMQLDREAQRVQTEMDRLEAKLTRIMQGTEPIAEYRRAA